MTVLRRADGRETTLHADRTTLGRAPGCDIVLDDPAVLPRHASILRTDRGWLLVDESGGATVQVDGVAVSNHFLRDGETLRLGTSELLFSDRGATLIGTPRPRLRPALELEGLRSVPVGAPPSSTPTTPGTRAPSSMPTLEGKSGPSPTPAPTPKRGHTEIASSAGAPGSEIDDGASSSDIALGPVVSGRTVVPAPIAEPPPWAGAEQDPMPRSTASIYEPPTQVADPDDRPFVDGSSPRRAASVYTLGDGPRASLDPVVDVYTIGQPGPGSSSRSVYSLGTAPTHPGPRASESSPYSIGEAETILPQGGGHAPVEPSRGTFTLGHTPLPSSASVYTLDATDGGPAPARRPAPAPPAPASAERGRVAGESWSWVQPEPARRPRRGSALGRPGRGLVTAGLSFVVLGLVLVAVAFALGLSIDEVSNALRGGR